MNIIEEYQRRKSSYTEESLFFSRRVKLISYIRLLIIVTTLVALYHHDKFNGFVLTGIVIALLVVFGFLVKYFITQKFKQDLYATIASINDRELDFLEKGQLPFENGQKYIDPQHAFSYDLDLFGNASLFQHLNRTHSYTGHQALSQSLTGHSSHEDIANHQHAIAELAPLLDWTQNYLALSELQQGKKSDYYFLKDWALDQSSKISGFVHILSFVLPLVFVTFFILNVILQLGIGNIVTLLFIINLGVLASQMKLINKETNKSTKLNQLLYNYGLLIDQIETQNWESDLLLKYKSELSSASNIKASKAIKELSKLFGSMDSINNAVGAALINGTFLYHIHLLRQLLKWKKENGAFLNNWLSVIGKIESLICFANFKRNNPTYSFPKLNHSQLYTFKDLGHPLIPSNQRVTSDVDFTNESFIILTGSNMSGKSTFLRSLGVNIVLAKAGSVVCASGANLDGLDLLVSMRSTDSLSDNESYFFAEVKRLQSIMSHAQNKVSFILLDEILRGTNSDDKRNGTIKFIEKLIQHNTIGVIATHDLEVCNTTKKYPNYLTNKCFEVDIKKDQLVFDYKLRDGICQNQSATFLMEKNGII